MNKYKIEVKNITELEKFLSDYCNDGQAYTISIVFGLAYIRGYKYPSKLPYNDYASSYNHQYWKSGTWNDFPIKSIIKYQNSDGGE